MLTEGDLVTSMNQSDKVRELQDKIASLRAQVRTSLPKSSNSGETMYYRKSSRRFVLQRKHTIVALLQKKMNFTLHLKSRVKKRQSLVRPKIG